GHVRLAGQERLFPQRPAVAQDLRSATDVFRQVADQYFRAVGGVPELRMRKVEIVHAFDDVVGKLVGERESDTKRRAVVADDVDAGDLGLLAAVLGEGGRYERRAGGDSHRAVAL